jgi:hypothetical protein
MRTTSRLLRAICGLPGTLQSGPRLDKKNLAHFSKPDDSLVARQQLNTEFLLEFLDLTRQCRLRDVKLVGCAHEAQLACHGDK